MLKDLQSIRLIAAVESVELAITKLSERPDILILDSDVSPLEAKSLVGGLARPTLIVLLRSADPAYLERAAQLPAKSFLPEEGLDRNKLVEVIQAALRGDLNIPAAMARHFLSRVAADGNSPALRLTSREEDVLRFLVQGLSNKEIARSLDISSGSVKRNVEMLLAKLNSPNRTVAAIRALREGLVESEV